MIGLKLSQHYRFREGAEYQRRALVLDPKHRKAQFQLAQDLLRLGDEDAGWILASQVKQQDGYNVVAHNLMALKEVIDGFVTLQEGNLHVRMDARESRIYGRAVLDLLTEARDQLTAKYNIQIDKPVLVEIFPAQKDFAIRTFGLPGGAGFLGVCFGRVVTANSPASQGATPSNWQSVLWHEFCHVITLEKTRNKMPRWLSEGISVYEERQRDGTWGDAMSPEYRTMILGGDLTPVSELSSAFLSPKSPMHLQFAYYESSQVIDFWVKQYGFESLLGLLDDLGAGIPINDALTRRAGSLPELDAAFEGYIKDLATHYGEKASWERDESLAELSVQGLQEQLKETPNQYWALELLADQLVEQRDFAQAKQVLQQAIDLFDPGQVPERLLKSQATVLAELKDAENERATLVKLLDQSSDAIDAFERLTEVAQESQDWDLLGRTAQRLRAVNPLLPSVQTAAALAAEKLDQPATAAEALMALVELDPIDPAGVYYRLAAAEHQLKQTEAAKRHVLMALEEAPRYRAALELLLSINGKSDAANEAASAESSLDAKPAEEKPADEKPDQVKADEAKGN